MFGKKYEIPNDGYHGEEIKDVANELKAKYNDTFINTKFNDQEILEQKEGEKIYNFVKDFFLCEIKKDLKKFGILIDI